MKYEHDYWLKLAKLNFKNGFENAMWRCLIRHYFSYESLK